MAKLKIAELLAAAVATVVALVKNIVKFIGCICKLPKKQEIRA